jgi:hypothetical protein
LKFFSVLSDFVRQNERDRKCRQISDFRGVTLVFPFIAVISYDARLIMTGAPSRFIGTEQSALFEENLVPRFVKEISIDASEDFALGRDNRPISSLTSVMKERLNRFKNRKADAGAFQEGLVIRAHRGDGISSASEEVARCLQAEAPNWNISGFSGSGAGLGLAEVSQDVWVGERRFVKDALRTRLIQRTRLFVSVQLVLLVIGGALLLLLGGLMLNEKVHWDKPQGWVGYLIASACGLLAPLIIKNVQLETNPRLRDQLTAALNSGAPTKELQSFVVATAGRLQNGFPRCFIIDDYSRLDRFTKDVLLHLMRTPSSRIGGAILWLIFDSWEEKAFFGELLTGTPVAREQFWEGNYAVFELQLMDLSQKIEVLQKRGLDETQATAHARSVDFVKHLIETISKAELQRLETNWNDFVAKNADANKRTAGATELFKFMVVNGSEVETELGDTELLSIFAQKSDGVFPELASVYYEKPKTLRRSEVEMALKEIRERLAEFLIMGAEIEAPLKIRRVAARIVENSPGGVLPLWSINLFWLLYWFNRWQGDKPMQPLRVRKLYQHALGTRLDEPLLEHAGSRKLCRQALEATLWIVTQCLYRTHIRRAVELIRTLMLHVDSLSRTEFLAQESFATLLSKVSGAAWTTYAISGNAAALSEMVEVLPDHERLSRSVGKRATTEIEVVRSHLELNGVSRANQMVGAIRIQDAMKNNKAAFKRLLDHMSLRRWEFLNLCAALGIGSTGIDSQSLAMTVRENWSDSVYDVPPDAGEQVSLFHYQNTIDYIRLLACCGELKEAQRRIKAFLEVQNEKDRAAGTLLEKAFLLEGVAACLDCFLSGLFSEEDEYGRTIDSRGYAFRRCSALKKPTSAQQELLEAFCTILNLPHSTGSDSRSALLENLAAQSARTYLQAAMAWDEFGLPNLRDTVLVRRAEFLFRATNANPSNPETYEGILGSISKAMERTDINGLVAHMLLAKFFVPLADLHGVYLLHCALQVLKSEFDDNIKFSFGVAAMRSSYQSDRKIAIVEKIIDYLRTPNGFTHATELLTPEDFATLVHELLDSVWVLQKKDLFKTILDFANNLPSHPYVTHNRDLAIYLRYHGLRLNVANGQKVDWYTVLPQWEDDRGHWMYAGVLNNALRANESDESIVNRCFDYLRESGFPVRSSPEIFLIHRLAALMLEQNRTATFAECANLLTDRVGPVLWGFSVENAVDTYALLLKLDPKKRAEHLKDHAFWIAIKLERDRAEKLHALMEQGHYWRIFIEYYQALVPYNLPTDVHISALFEELKKSPKAALEWISNRDESERRELLTMILCLDNREVILEDFVAFGLLVFNAPESEYAFVKKTKNDLDEACASQIGRFFAVVARTRTVPENLRRIFDEHRHEVDSWLGRRFDQSREAIRV